MKPSVSNLQSLWLRTEKWIRPALILILVPTAMLSTACDRSFVYVDASKSKAQAAPSADLLQGKTLYAANCMSCHGPVESSKKRNYSADQIRGAIVAQSQMAHLKSLSDSEINMIAQALNDNPVLPPKSSDGVLYACTSPELRGKDNQTLRRLSRTEVLASLTTIFGADLMNTSAVASRVSGIPEDAETNGAINQKATFEAVVAYTNLFDDLTTEIFKTASSARQFGGDCFFENPDPNCLRSFVNRMALSVQRRILKTSESNDYLTKATSGSDAGITSAEQFKLVLMRLLLSPDFLFQIEEGQAAGQLLSLSPTLFSRYANGAIVAGVNTAQNINDNGEWIVHVNAPGRPAGDPIYSKVYKKLIVIASGTPGADGSYPSFQLDWNLQPVEGRQDLTRVKGANQIFVFEGNFGYMMDQSDAARAGLYQKFQLGFNMRGSAGAAGSRLTIEGVALVDESGTPTPENGRQRLGSLEVANRIALRLSDGGPDASLILAALRSELQSTAQVNQHARRILQSAAGQAKTVAIFRDYTKLKKQLAGAPAVSPQQLNGLDVNGINTAMSNEFEDYIKNQVFSVQATFAQIMTSSAVYPRTPALATIYGTSTWSGNPALAPQSGTHKGLLHRAAFLFSARSRTSPILRGVAIRKNILCDSVDSPDAATTAMRDNSLNGVSIDQLSTRQLVTVQTNAVSCMQCHRNINPLGFAFESFDSFGRFRTTEQVFNLAGQQTSAHAVDSSATDLRIGDQSAASTSGSPDLVEIFARSEKAQACLTKRIAQQTLRREVTPTDGCLLSDVKGSIQDSRTSIFESLLKSVSTEDIFFTRAK